MLIGKKFSCVTIALLSTQLGQVAFANPTSTDLEREEIVIFSRQGDSQLAQAIKQLSALYKRTQDVKVRDDLIALMIRKEQFKEATLVCAKCSVSAFSESELENLARAYRNTKNLPKSLQLYTQLRIKYPQNPNGLLGSALLETELAKYPAAKKHLVQYKARFGADAGYKDAQNFLLDRTEPEVSKLGRWQSQLEAEPKNEKLALALYRLAASLRVHPLQDFLVKQYPTLFTAKDSNWLQHGEVISSVRGNLGLRKQGLMDGYQRLSRIIEASGEDPLLYQNALQDRIVLASRMHKNTWVANDYATLETLNQPIPSYVKEAYADALLYDGSPFKALEIYQFIEAEQRKTGHIETDLLLKLVNASSDAGLYQQAQNYQDQLRQKEGETVWDFTHKARLVNPNYDRMFYSQVNVDSWRGDRSTAIERLQTRLTEVTPGDPWVMLELAAQESARNNHDQANDLTDRAAYFLEDDTLVEYKKRSAEIALNQGNYSKAHSLIKELSPEEREKAEALLKLDKEMHRGSIVASMGLSHQTAPQTKSSNETTQEYYVNSPKTADGHYAYVHYLEEKVPTDNIEVLKQRRFGAGVWLNIFPFNLNVETGKGIKLNDKGYLTLNSDYTLNENWRFDLSGNINSSQTPIKAINQGVYAKDVGLGATYTYRDLFKLSAGVNVMKFDDGNRRQNYYVQGSIQTFKRDRWALNNSLRFDYQRNKTIESAWYFNPSKSRNIDFSADLSYYQPMNYGVTLTHHLKGSTGQYKQQHHSAERSWSASYGHDWRINKRIQLEYEIGRKKNIYDGAAEFNNYGNVNFSLAF